MIGPAATGTVFVVRHGRTAANKNTYLGWDDPPLDAVGVAQAALLLDELTDEHLDAIYSSPLQRAIQTVRPIADAHGLEIRVRSGMREIDYGDYQGVSKEAQPLKLRREHRYRPVPAGESLFDVYCRVKEFTEEIAPALREGKRIAVAGHYWSNRILVGCLEGVPFAAMMDAPRYKPANGSVLEVTCRPAHGGLEVGHAALRCNGGEASR